jgi:hypothetical protein
VLATPFAGSILLLGGPSLAVVAVALARSLLAAGGLALVDPRFLPGSASA